MGGKGKKKPRQGEPTGEQEKMGEWERAEAGENGSLLQGEPGGLRPPGLRAGLAGRVQPSAARRTMAKKPRKRPRAATDDVYEAEDVVADEEKHAGQRYDRVDNYEFELPSDFEDEEIDEEAAFTEEDKKLYADWFGEAENGSLLEEDDRGLLASSEEDDADHHDPDDFSDEEAEQETEELEAQHRRMVEDVTGGAAKRPRRNEEVITEALPESELNLQPYAATAGEGGGELRMADLIAGLGPEARRLGSARRTLDALDAKLRPLEPPLPGPVRARKQRQAGYEAAQRDVTKWQPLVKAHREAPTIAFAPPRGEVARLASTAALAGAHAPATPLEAEVAALLAAAGAANGGSLAEAEDALAAKAVGAEEAAARREQLAKMRSLLFHHEAKLKHLKKIKSKDYHRRALRAARAKAAKAGEAGDEEEAEGLARAAAEEAELRRARERLTLKHRNTSHWARRALRRGVAVLDDGMRGALEEQLRLGQELRQKPAREDAASGGSSDASTEASDEDEAGGEGSQGSDGVAPAPRASKARARLKAAAADLFAGEASSGAAAPATGLFALPFMQRGAERRKAEARAEAAALLRELEREDAQGETAAGAGAGAWGQHDDDEDTGAPAMGRRAFGAGQLPLAEREPVASSGEGLEASGSGSDEEGAEADADRRASALEAEPLRSAVQHVGVVMGGRDQRGRCKAGQPTGVAQVASAATAVPGLYPRHLSTEGPLFVEGPLGGAAVQEAAPPEDEGSPGNERADKLPPGKAEPPAALPGELPHTVQSRVAAARRNSLLNPRRGAGAGGRAAALPASALGLQNGAAVTVGPAPIPRAAGTGCGSSSRGSEPFIPATAFQGPRPGCTFRRGPQGVGYYREGLAPLQVDAERAPANAKAMPSAAETAHGGGPTAHDADDDSLMVPATGGAAAQRALIARAFAGDDVAAEFEAAKAADAEAEAPADEGPSVLPGWGAWASQQRTPTWVEAARAKAQLKRAAALASRKDARRPGVVISKKYDRRGVKYATPAVPFPFDSKATYERARRQPLGPDFNTAAAHRDMTRPAVVKMAGAVIPPLKYSQPVAKMAAKQPGNNAQRKAIARIEGGMPRASKK